jgi:hypothetical protein
MRRRRRAGTGRVVRGAAARRGCRGRSTQKQYGHDSNGLHVRNRETPAPLLSSIPRFAIRGPRFGIEADPPVMLRRDRKSLHPRRFVAPPRASSRFVASVQARAPSLRPGTQSGPRGRLPRFAQGRASAVRGSAAARGERAMGIFDPRGGRRRLRGRRRGSARGGGGSRCRSDPCLRKVHPSRGRRRGSACRTRPGRRPMLRRHRRKNRLAQSKCRREGVAHRRARRMRRNVGRVHPSPWWMDPDERRIRPSTRRMHPHEGWVRAASRRTHPHEWRVRAASRR